MRGLRAALRFLTRMPVPGPPTAVADLPSALLWFPLVGAGVGLLIGAGHVQLTNLWPAPVAAVLAIAFGLLLTGAMHEDAVADAADGLGGGFDREQVLRILGDSRVGAYGVLAVWVLLSLRLVALVALGPLAPPALALAMAWGRWTALPLLRWLPALHPGLGRDLSGAASWVRLLGGSFAALLVTVAVWPWLAERALVAVPVVLVVTTLWGGYLQRRLGGQSGDLLGAGNQLVEAAVLLVCLAGIAA